MEEEGEGHKDEDSNIITTMVNNKGEKKKISMKDWISKSFPRLSDDGTTSSHVVATSSANHIQEGLDKDVTIEKVVTLAHENSRNAKADQTTPTKQVQYMNKDQNNMLQLTVHAENVEETDDNISAVAQVNGMQKVEQDAIDIVQSPRMMQTDETQLWLGNAEDPNIVLHNIVSHNIEDENEE
ncbi:hypothetical protein KY290_021280 [Solanum tuberosum]|uniref:Uncharacterized protein n=1 Tax=Solanum tuberosum TaxID=4113 RepID=A0ABQ7V144_SOLTU|nr:hypothetical protein KY289_020445 [Solanum tuberosum]KAH0693103.1 hypothetical protein KY285_020200 [Solanum tuberosum]KAH0757787.1 hypothetical protein KY290_021280 [Solanum tuberosum]